MRKITASNKLSLKDKIRISQLGLKAQGAFPWAKDETDTFLALYLELANKKARSSKTYFERIAIKLNRSFHKGKKVRTARSLSVHKYNLKNSRSSMKDLKTKYKNHPFFIDPLYAKNTIYEKYSDQIVQMYKNLKTKEEIVNVLNLTQKYGISLLTAKSYISPILNKKISKRQMKTLLKKHLSQATKKRNVMYGLPKITDAVRKASAERMKSMTSKERTALSHLAIRAKGHMPWDEKETNLFLKMCTQKKYQHRIQNGTTRADHKLIAEVLNNRFHEGKEIRTPRSLTVKKDNLKKRVKKLT
ncbi:MAG: hypothetical protein IH875_09320 [Candidatus Dadabacteria bacterium]|nr:hypothetical protein [Candidatus Dadabacteria bacterium]